MSELETVDREVLMSKLNPASVTPIMVEVAQVVEQSALPIKLDHIAALVKLYDKGVAERNALDAELAQLEETIQVAMGAAETAMVKGVRTFTFNWKQSWRTTELKKDHGHLTKNYMVKQVTEKFDAKAFAKDHPSIAREYQTREFRRVSGTRNAVGR